MTAVSVEEAAARIRRGELVAYPTETVWGLAADARSPRAIARLRAWKGRGEQKALSVLVGDFAALAALGAEATPLAARLAAKFWPGPLTLVVRCEGAFAPGVADAGGAVGFRCSPHPVASALARVAGAITATSFNRAAGPPCATRAQAEACAGGEIALVAGDDASGAAPSSVVDATGERLRMLREGAIPARALEDAVRGEASG
jgi:tRNA threonylcarbamoyl adenosine modification protein (Sua5/YciO/YrdC/YwlC family)